METRHLRYFVAVAEELHFGKAAKKLHISQPPLSQQIMKFEEELGVSLFERSKRSVFLTAAGKSFLEDARRILIEIEQAKTKLQAMVDGVGGSLELGYIAPALDTPFTNIVKVFKNTYPGVRLGLREMPTNEQLETLRSGEIDIAVVRLFKHNTEGLLCYKFHQESYALVVPNNHWLAGKINVNISELAKEEFIFFPRKSQPLLFDAWMAVFQRYDFTPNIVQEVLSKAASMALVAAGMGIAIVPESLSQRAIDHVVFKPLVGGSPTLEMHIVYKGHSDHASRNNFLRIAQNRQN